VHPLDHVYAVLIAAALPAYAWLASWQNLREVFDDLDARGRAAQYWSNVVALALVVGLALALWLWRGRSPADLGLAAGGSRATLTLLAGLALAAGLAFYYRRLLGRAGRLGDIKRELLADAPVVPRARADLPSWTALSLTAGVAEEIVYRGYLIWYLAHSMPEPLAVPCAAAVFTLGHLYQSPKSAAKVFLLALVFGGLYVWSGALWPVMVAHAMIDFAAGVFSIRLFELTGGAPSEGEAA